MELLFQQGGWRCYCHAKYRHLFSNINDVEAILASLNSLPLTLKNNHRSVVKRGELFGVDIVAKQPRDKHRRLWARFVSLWSTGESRQTVENLAKLQQAGIETVTPLFALEQRAYGMVIDSWACYEYRTGQSCGESSLNEIIELLGKMHAAGFRHDDPTWNNFLHDDHGVLFTIDTKAKPCRSTFHATNDFLLLKKANKLKHLDLQDLPGVHRNTLGYWLAVTYASIKTGRSALKNKLKKNRPKNV